ncbi:MAG: ATP-binding protein [Candidatus Omnitrophota bacterium]
MKISKRRYFFGISTKIWLSLSIMIIGYTIWMVVGYFRNRETLARLNVVQEYIFPATVQSSIALSRFNEQVKLYKDAVVFGKPELVKEARARATESLNALRALQNLSLYDKLKGREIQQIYNRVKRFTASADSLYFNMASAVDDKSTQADASSMTSMSEDIRNKLTALSETLSSILNEELVAVGNATRRHQFLNVLFFFLTASGSLITVSIIISRLVTHPLKKAAALAVAMAGGDLSRKLDIHQYDEIGELGHAMNVMAGKVEESHSQLEQKVADRTASLQEAHDKLANEIAERKKASEELEIAHKKLVETAWMVGKAEVASTVLHNVGNVFNSVNVTVGLLTQKNNHSKIHNFVRIATMIEEHLPELGDYLTTDVKGREIPGYLIALSKHLEEEQKRMGGMLKDLNEHMRHIVELIAIQQHGASAGLTEMVSVAELIENAIQINTTGVIHCRIEIRRKFDPMPHVRLDHHKFMQIIINLISNARHALKASPAEPKILEIRLRHKEDGKFLTEVMDNGIGIEKENLDKIFNLGFTTRKNGHGYGLHSAAISAKEMGGSLNVHSDGPGKGALFILELPFILT